jgi:3-isopropylmalate/(R)-2-methylmalate dehydratase large subunit
MDTDALTLTGRVLFLSENPGVVLRQLHGEDLDLEETLPLRRQVTEDEIVPGWVSFYFYQRLGDFPYLGLLCGASFPVSEGAVLRGGFEVVVSGAHHGAPGAKEVAPFAERSAGLRLVIAESFDPTYRRNAHALGLLTSTDTSLVARIRQGEALPMATFTAGLDPLTAEIVRAGGIFSHTRARLQGLAGLPLPVCAPRAMTLAEKILARAAVNNLATQATGLPSVQPGDGVLAKAAWRTSHEGATLLAATMLDTCLGQEVPFSDPAHILAFRDHLAFKDHFRSHDERQPGLLGTVQRMNSLQEEFCKARGIHLHGETSMGSSEGISHILMTDRYVLPGQLVVGTDSHTCHNGALGALAFGVGAADIANAWVTGDVRVTVPESGLIRLNGKLPAGVCAKDLVLHLLTLPALCRGQVDGQILEYQGEALAALSTDERCTLTNMAADLGALAGIVAPDGETLRFLRERRGLTLELEPWMRSDPAAQFAFVLEVDCGELGPMVAAPGNPSQGTRLAALGRHLPVDIAYVGSCTGGKCEDIERVFEVVKWARDHGLTLPLQVQFFIQLGSDDVWRHAERLGWLTLFEEVGARVLRPGCGACINAGPGVSARADQVTISAVNRNFAGRSGPGQVWLASPATVAASAFGGRICGFGDLQA